LLLLAYQPSPLFPFFRFVHSHLSTLLLLAAQSKMGFT
jgi:hypothetical protein